MKFKYLMIIGLILIGLMAIPIGFASDLADGHSADSGDAIAVDDHDFSLESNGISKDYKNSLKSIDDDRLIGNRTYDDSSDDSLTESSGNAADDSTDNAVDGSSNDVSDVVADLTASGNGDDTSSNDLTTSSNMAESDSEIRTITTRLNDYNANINGLDYTEYSDYINLNNQLLSYDFNLTSGNTIYVNASYDGSYELGTKDNPFKTLYNAYNSFRLASNTKTNVFLAAGIYTVSSRMIITKNLNLIGESLKDTLIYCNDMQAFTITPPSGSGAVSPLVNIVNLTFSNGSYYSGGVIYINESAVNIVNCIFRDSNTYDSYMSSYSANGGVIYNERGFLRIYNSLFANNTAEGDEDACGAAIFNEMGEISILGSQFINNTAIGENAAGGAIYDYSGILIIFNSSISGNTLISNYSIGGGLCTWASHNVFIINSTFDSNEIYGKYTFGSAISNKANILAIDNTTFSNNLANGTSDMNGTFFNLNGILNLSNLTFSNNMAIDPRDDLLLCLEDQLILSDAFSDEDIAELLDELELDVLPSSYNLNDYGLVTSVKDQGGSGSCWAFSTLAALESYLLKYENVSYDLSENNMKNLMGSYGLNGTDWSDGGNHFMSLAYLLRWSGPVNESQDPFSDTSHSSKTFSNITKQVQDVLYVPLRLNYLDTDQIKAAILKYGALYTTIHSDDSFQYSSDYYLDVISVSNHAITLVGWDDNYSADNFARKAPGDGAFIIKNSWGTNYGYDGYWYISYYDKSFAGFGLDTLSAMAITNAENASTYRNNYQYDILGNTFESLGYNSNTAWMANQFTAKNANPLAAVGFYTFGTSEYLINITVNGISKLIQEGSVKGAGYHTVKLDSYVDLAMGDVFKAMVRLTTPDSVYPIAVESKRSSYSSGASSNPGESFISPDGETWSDLYESSELLKFYQYLYGHNLEEANVCLKAYTIGASDVHLAVKSNASAYSKGDLVQVNITLYNDGDAVSDLNLTIVLDGTVSLKSFSSIHGSFDSTNKVWHLDSLSEGETKKLSLVLEMKGSKEAVDFIFDYNFSGYVPGNISTSQVMTLYYEGVCSFVPVDDVASSPRSNDSVEIQLVNPQSKGLSGREVIVSLLESDNGLEFENQTLSTDGDGKVSFVLDLLEGNYTFMASFMGDEFYRATNVTFNVSVSKTDASIELNDVNGLSQDGNPLDLTALTRSNDTVNFTLSDGESNISDREIVISLIGSDNEDLFEDISLMSDSSGQVSFVIDLLEGSYTFMASFGGDDFYNAANLTFHIDVLKRASSIELDSSELSSDGSQLMTLSRSNDTVGFTLLNQDSSPLANRTILVTIDGSSDSAESFNLTTDSNGFASFDLDLSESDYEVIAKYMGDDYYSDCEMGFNLSVVKRDAPHLIADDGIINASNPYIVHLLDDGFNPIADQSVLLVLSSGNQSFSYSARTDEKGVAVFDELSDMESGSYALSISLEENELYEVSSIEGNATVINEKVTYPSIGTAFKSISDLNVFANANKTIELAFLDELSNPLADKPIGLKIVDLKTNDSIVEVNDLSTDSKGIIEYVLKLDEGDYEFIVSFDGDDEYCSSGMALSLSVSKRATMLFSGDSLINLSGEANEYNVLLLDGNGNPIANETVIFSLSSDDAVLKYYEKTDNDGKASIDLDGLDEGKYIVNATFSSNELFEGSDLSKEITLIKDSQENASSKIGTVFRLISDLNVYANADKSLDFQLLDDSYKPLADMLIRLNINPSAKEYVVKTDSKGIASFAINLGEGVYELDLKYDGNDGYSSSGLALNLSVSKKMAKIMSEDSLVNISSEKNEYKVVLVDDGFNPIANETVVFSLSKDNRTLLNNSSKTGADGAASLDLAGLVEGDYILKAIFNSSDAFEPANLTKAIRLFKDDSNGTGNNDSTPSVARKATRLLYENMVTQSVVSKVDGRTGEYFYVTLVDGNGNPLSNRTIKIGFNGRVYNKTTNESGCAGLQINLQYIGTYTFAICFLGDDDYNASFEVAKITVNKKKMSLTVPNKSYKSTAKTKTLTATLRDNKNQLVAGKKVTFTVNGKTYTAKTNSKGVASVKVSLSSKKTYSFTAKFAGDSFYGAVTKSAKLTIK